MWPSGTRLELRSRSGDELEQNFTFYDKNLKEVTEKRWDKLIPSFRGSIDTTTAPGGDWNPWSNIYAASGQTFLSPSLRCFVQLDVRLVSYSPLRAPSLDWVSLDFRRSHRRTRQRRGLSLPSRAGHHGDLFLLAARPCYSRRL